MADVVFQFEPFERRDGGVAMQAVAVRAGADDILSHCLLPTAEAVTSPRAKFGIERRDVLRSGEGEAGGA